MNLTQRVVAHCVYCGLAIKPGRTVCVGHTDVFALDPEADHALALAFTENNRPGPHELDAQNAGRG